MKIHTLVFRQVDRKNFDAVRDGLKTVETRAATIRYRDMQPGDQLVIKCGTDRITKQIKEVRHFASIEALLKDIPLSNVMPFAKTLADVEREYYSYRGYKEKIAEHGLIALFL